MEKIVIFTSYFGVQTKVVTGAGHHVYADKADVFNKYVNEICQLADSGDNLRKLSMPKLSSLPDLEDERSNTESDENISATESTREPTPQNTPS
ncbi:hypothetical protein C0J52_23904 [Blattella germanica]|nr:hypothetical protein C0J52_23904 [Blattella germanica]